MFRIYNFELVLIFCERQGFISLWIVFQKGYGFYFTLRFLNHNVEDFEILVPATRFRMTGSPVIQQEIAAKRLVLCLKLKSMC